VQSTATTVALTSPDDLDAARALAAETAAAPAVSVAVTDTPGVTE
jgi:hypothetical protein